MQLEPEGTKDEFAHVYLDTLASPPTGAAAAATKRLAWNMEPAQGQTWPSPEHSKAPSGAR